MLARPDALITSLIILASEKSTSAADRVSRGECRRGGQRPVDARLHSPLRAARTSKLVFAPATSGDKHDTIVIFLLPRTSLFFVVAYDRASVIYTS